MDFEDVGNPEETYMSFYAGGIAYVIPLADVGQIVAEVPQDIPQIQLSGKEGRGECAVIFQDGQGLAALKVEKVTGLTRIPPSFQYELPEQARSPQNRWIAGVAFLESLRCLSYLLDCGQLRARFLTEPS